MGSVIPHLTLLDLINIKFSRIYAALVARLNELGWIDTLKSSAKGTS